MSDPAPKKATCGHPALYTWHYTAYRRTGACLYCLAAELAAAQNDLAAATALGPTFKAYPKKLAAAGLRQARAIIAICQLVKP
jgi:hypothetical protein